MASSSGSWSVIALGPPTTWRYLDLWAHPIPSHPPSPCRLGLGLDERNRLGRHPKHRAKERQLKFGSIPCTKVSLLFFFLSPSSSSSSFLPSFFLSFLPTPPIRDFPSPSITSSSSLLLSIRGLVILGKRIYHQCLRFSAFRPCTPVSGTSSRYPGPLTRPSSSSSLSNPLANELA